MPQASPISLNEQIEVLTSSLTSIIVTADVLLDGDSIGILPTPGWVQKFQEFTDWLSGQKLTSVQKRKHIELFAIGDTGLEIAEEARFAGLTPDEMGDWIKTRAQGEIKLMPSLGLFGEVLQQKHLNPGTNWNGNDLVDLMYLTSAAGYADYVVGENSLVSQMEQALKRLKRRLNVYRNLRDLVTALESDGFGS